mmetsp:Transcript_18603/g.54509  ORF Transcript_18603/g.54509 Transcript_18603/m.54509 type:complete len:725 (+) Transcript_18603:3053-5227(+)
MIPPAARSAGRSMRTGIAATSRKGTPGLQSCGLFSSAVPSAETVACGGAQPVRGPESPRPAPGPLRRAPARRSGDNVWLGAPRELCELGLVEGDLGEGLDHVEGVLGQVPVGRLVLFEVEAHGGAVHARARKSEDDAAAVSHDEADALVLGHRAVHGVGVGELVQELELVARLELGAALACARRHGLHHLGRGRLVHPLEVVARVVVAAVGLPVLRHHVRHAEEGLARVRVLCGEDLQPREHRPHAVLLPHVVGARAETLLAAEEGRVGLALGEHGGAAVHQVAEELPTRGHLEALQLLGRRHAVEGRRGGHGARARLEASVLVEVGDGVRVGGNGGERVGGRAEEVVAEDHVAVRVAVRRGAKLGRRLGRGHLVAALVQAHLRDELHGVREVWVRVAVRRGRGSAEVRLGLRVDEGGGGQAQLLAEHLLGVGPLHAVHRVVDHGEVGPLHEGLDLREVKAVLEHGHVVLGAVEHLHRHGAHRHRGWLVQGHVREGGADLVGADLRGALVDVVGHLLRRGPAVGHVELDAKVLVNAARVVRRAQDEAAKRLEALAAGADHRGHGGRGEEAARAHPDAAHAVGRGHLEDDLDGLGVVEAAIARDDECASLDGHLLGEEGVKHGLHEVVQVGCLHEGARLLAQTRGARLLAVDGLGRHLLGRHRVRARGARKEVGDVGDGIGGLGLHRVVDRLGEDVLHLEALEVVLNLLGRPRLGGGHGCGWLAG